MDRVVTPGDVITRDQAFMRGHGTFISEQPYALSSSVGGRLQIVNRLVSVEARSRRYAAEIGDVVVGRVLSVGNKRWRVEINGRQDGVLLLSSINLPGGVQRRKCEEDELMMREFYKENDLVCAEVQTNYSDGAVGIHTRNETYGRLGRGVLVQVPAKLVPRSKTHFGSLLGLSLILGVNGWIWISGEDFPSDDPSVEHIRASMDIYERVSLLKSTVLALEAEKRSITFEILGERIGAA